MNKGEGSGTGNIKLIYDEVAEGWRRWKLMTLTFKKKTELSYIATCNGQAAV